MFIATRDASTPPDDQGNRVVSCVEISGHLGEITVTRGLRLLGQLERLIGPILP